MRSSLLSVLKALVVLILLNVVGNIFYTRADLTEDKRYTLSVPAINAVAKLGSPVMIDILLDGNLPPEFLRLKDETRQLLEEFAAKNKSIQFAFVDPLKDAASTEEVIAELHGLGLTPTHVMVDQGGKVSQEIIFPWAIINYDQKSVKVPLLKNKIGTTTEDRVNNSVQHLEYAFANAFAQLNLTDKKRVAIIKGNGQLEDLFIADFLTTIRDYYNLGAITLDSVANNPQKVLDQLREFDLALIAKPTEAFTDEEKFIMDQYITGGGKSLWLIDQVAMEVDSLYNENGTAMAFPRQLNLNDFFFRYGVRLNANLVNDMYFTQIVLATGEDNDSQYNPVPWYYHPMVFSKNDHPINTNIEAVRFQFTGSMDTLPNAYSKKILLQSSPLSKIEGVPRQISLDIINTAPDKESYANGNKPLAVLVEGEFNSTFTNRVKPVALNEVLDKGPANKMIVIADGDVIKNQIRNGRPLELGYDKWTNNYYGNKEFLINSLNYLLDDNGLINIRTKQVAIPFLDEVKIEEQKNKWQLINIGLPLVLTLIFGWAINALRRKKYSR
ncbi:gliding motility-associated ABC transporter substrate-binding protein GldG [Arenibacter certesii]|uniref:Gliding motility-associated ABC transporter substrate-binding protein GldG n=1 Tax=Arenibacter certesii TaxID=228955 RepID=A0A918MNF0_9FLAO|nr:gliding motility-associated ABC transporter substrate-binding protein GldG [Arenibacter certesii]GGW41514.1 gliding motility-associated ABC transporter substrate-binding protein GldG [Arenibacter certesii]